MQRYRIWQFNKLFYCPLIGVCLTQRQQRHLLKRNGVDLSELSSYKAHVLMIDMVKRDTKIAREVESFLNSKFQRELAQWRYKNPHRWMKFVRETLSADTVAALLWISAAYVELSDEACFDLYGEVHMLLHELSLSQAHASDKYNTLKKQNRSLKESSEEIRKRNQQLKKEHRTIERENQALKEELVLLRQENAQLKMQRETVSTGREEGEERRKMEEKVASLESMVEVLRQERTQLREENAENEDLLCSLKQAFDTFLQRIDDTSPEVLEGSCPKAHLCNRRILLVGGISKMRSFYEQIITQLGGQFSYHDGHSNSSSSRAIQSLVEKSDLVLCPVDVNSHHACLQVKRVCKTCKTPYIMLRSASLTSVHQTLSQLKEHALTAVG